jgi:DNA-binding MarR family transcriptional regulator
MDAETVTRFRIVIGRLARDLNASTSNENLTLTQASVLATVAVRGSVGLADLAELENLNPTMLSRVIGKLDELELIRRVPNPDDLRSASVEVTASGRDMQERIRAARAEIISACMDRLPAAAQANLLAALPELETLSGEIRAIASPRRVATP